MMNDKALPSGVPDVRSRARGALLGLAVGDAVGTTLEFTKRDSTAPLTDMIGGGPFNLPVGFWTDDTSMALALADSLIAHDGLNPNDLMQRFCAWWRDGEYSPTGNCFDIGNATSSALASFERTGDPIAGSTHHQSAGNGSLMRLSPIAIRGARRDPQAMRVEARLQSSTTHAAAACLDACEAWAIILRAVILGADIEEAIERVTSLKYPSPIGPIIAGSWQEKSRSEISSSGYVVHSLEAALWCNSRGANFREIVLLAANLGDDADTVAAIAGQLAGARFGVDGIPDEWLKKIAWGERLIDTADRLLEIS
jgi:ADP-ribosyl-[dinitrogen reductase] hydrolase